MVKITAPTELDLDLINQPIKQAMTSLPKASRTPGLSYFVATQAAGEGGTPPPAGFEHNQEASGGFRGAGNHTTRERLPTCWPLVEQVFHVIACQVCTPALLNQCQEACQALLTLTTSTRLLASSAALYGLDMVFRLAWTPLVSTKVFALDAPDHGLPRRAALLLQPSGTTYLGTTRTCDEYMVIFLRLPTSQFLLYPAVVTQHIGAYCRLPVHSHAAMSVFYPVVACGITARATQGGDTRPESLSQAVRAPESAAQSVAHPQGPAYAEICSKMIEVMKATR